MKKISLQVKIILLALILILIPIIATHLIFAYHKVVFTSRGVVLGAKDITGLMKSYRETPVIEEIQAMPLEAFQVELPEDEEDGESSEEASEETSNEDEEATEETEGEGKPVAKTAKAAATDGEEEDEAAEGEDVIVEGEESDTNKIAVKASDDEESEEEDGDEDQPKKPRLLTTAELQAAKDKAIADAISVLEVKSGEALALDDFIQSKADDLEKLDAALKSLEIYYGIYFYASIFFVIIALVLLWTFIGHATNPIKEVVDRLKSFQNEGESTSQDMLECAFQFDSFLATARTLLTESHSIAQEIGRKLEPLTVMSVFSDDNVKQLFTDVQEISRSSNYIANTLESTTSHIQEVSASAQTIADRSHEAATDSAETAAIAGEGKNAVSETIDTMESIKDEVLGLEDVIENLNSASMQIGEIVNTITNIAYQTNLLALNAAIEAARAGEHGQGFTVVAGEVKKLAEESGEAAEDISKKIKEMLKKTGKAVETINRGATKVIEGVNIANLAGNNLDKIVSSVSNVNKMIQDISNASTEQSQNIDSLRGSIESITGATKMTSEGTKRVATAVNDQLAHIRQYISVTKELLTLAQMMSDMLDKFNLN